MTTSICCCNHEPPTLRCGACQNGDCNGCLDPSMPARPTAPRSLPRTDTYVKRPNPSDPGKPSKGMPKWLSGIIIFVGMAFFAAFLFAIVSDGPNEDRREVRRYGDLECVYNVTTDEVESCVKVTG